MKALAGFVYRLTGIALCLTVLLLLVGAIALPFLNGFIVEFGNTAARPVKTEPPKLELSR